MANLTEEEDAKFLEVLDMVAKRPTKLLDYTDVEWDGIMGDYHQQVGIAYTAFLEGLKFGKEQSKNGENL